MKKSVTTDGEKNGNERFSGVLQYSDDNVTTVIIISGILALAGNAIQGEVYSWVAVVVLPINSLVNPVIYTLLAALQKRKKVIVRDRKIYNNLHTYIIGITRVL